MIHILCGHGEGVGEGVRHRIHHSIQSTHCIVDALAHVGIGGRRVVQAIRWIRLYYQISQWTTRCTYFRSWVDSCPSSSFRRTWDSFPNRKHCIERGFRGAVKAANNR